MAKSQGMAPSLSPTQTAADNAQGRSSHRSSSPHNQDDTLMPLAQLAHEVKNPLSVILHRVQMLAMTPEELTPTQRRYVAQIALAAEEIRIIVENMQDLTLSETGQVSLHRSPIAPVELVERTVAQLAPLAEEKQQHVRAVITTDMPPLFVDGARVQQILTNLLANAIKFTQLGGTIEVGAQPGPAGAVDFFVRDNGPGIAKKYQAAIFRPFVRIRTTSAQGTGVGLALARQLTELHQGTIWVESRWRKGSTFWARLPNTNDPAAIPEGEKHERT